MRSRWFAEIPRDASGNRDVPNHAGLVRGVRRWDLVALVINSVIGAGIFGLPSRAFALAGAWSLLAYALSALAIFLVILCFAEVGSRFQATGGPYLYARVSFGPFVAFQVGWLMWLGRMAAFASLANLFVVYLEYFLPGAAANPLRPVIIVILTSAIAVANVTGVRVTTTVTDVLTAGKLFPLFLLAIAGLAFISPRAYAAAPSPPYASFSQAALLLAFTYMGFEGASIPSGEIDDPKRHLPFALLTGLAVIVLVYALIQAVCIGTVPDLARSERPLSDAALRVMGVPGAILIGAGALISIAGTLNALMFATPRLLFAMAEHGQLPSALAATHRRFRTPAAAIAVTALVTLVLTLSSTFVSALTMSAVVRLLAYASTCAALPVLRGRAGAPRAAFAVPGGAAVSVAALGLIAWLLSNTPRAELRVATAAIVLGIAFWIAGRQPLWR